MSSSLSKSSPADDLAHRALLDDDDAPVAVSDATASTGAASPSDVAAPAKTPATPAERWRAAIKEAGIDERKANRILDDLVANGFYQDEVSLLNGRMRVTFRTREPENINRTLRAVSALPHPVTQQAHDTTTAIYNLAGGLARFWKKGMRDPVELPFPTGRTPSEEASEMFIRRMNFVLNPDHVAAPVLYTLFDALARFDRQVQAALSEGAAEGF